MASLRKTAGLRPGLSASLWPFQEAEELFLVFQSSSIEAMTWASEGYDFSRAETLLACGPFLPRHREGRQRLLCASWSA